MIALFFVALLAPGCPAPMVDGPKMHAAGEAALAAGRDGEHLSARGFEVARQAFRAAAEAGHPPAQYALAKLVISTLYMAGGIVAKQKADYVEALTWLAVAGALGHAEARTLLPAGVTAKLFGGTAPADPDDAFGDLPAAWITAARTRAAQLAGCWPAKRR